MSKTLINFLINNFTDLSNVETQGILKVFNFALVSSIDNKRLLYKQYYYTSEYLKDYYKISSLIENISYKEIIDVYIQICMAINYLHLRGIKYEEINLENILLYKKDNKLKVDFKTDVHSIINDSLLEFHKLYLDEKIKKIIKK